ncbi:hypothetical protein GPK89_04715 [Gemmiger formicilis]|uniref:InlB B-repeat-containing protein n=1 Tax=Gemmiger formicilis TaxID=745368 RepID=UPI001C0148E1|nr:InlB B-repeat-containing protein [Gemmiger formicilis]MBT9674037.1 hypothetical protein [Gemmiger formicilis]
MKKRLFAILMTLCLLTQLFPITASAVRAPMPHPSAHCVCGGNHRDINGHTSAEVVYFTKDGKENTSGDISKMNVIKSEEDLWEIHSKAANNKGKTFYYYLANDVTLTRQIYVWEGCTFVICLHGHTLTCNVPNAGSAFLLMNNARLVFTDCQVSGDRGLITGDSYAAVSVAKTATFELYGVSICMTSSETDGIRDVYNDPVCGVYNAGTFNMYGGCPYFKSDEYPTDRPVISNIRNTQNGAGVVNVGTFNMYDGIISGNERNGVMSTITRSDDTINLYGGTITGNTGAGISATHWPMPSIATSDYYTNVNLYGGTISENTGAGIDAAYGRVTMAQQNNAIPVEIKNNKGGAISLTRDGSTAKLGTGTITGNSGGKGAVALSAGSLTLTGDVKITGNTGANLYLASGKTVTLDKLGSGAQIGVTTGDTAVPVVFAAANGTDYASRFTPDSVGYSIGYNAAQQLQLQTVTYPVTYAPGANGTGDSKTVNKEHGKALELQGALFTRLGYTQVGWSKVDGGEMDYSLNAIYEQNEALTLYPVWEERSDYTVHIVNRDGSTVTELKNVKWTDEIWKLLTPTPTRENGELLKRLLLGTSIVYGGDTYGKFATGGEDSLTFVAVWDGTFANRSTISVGDSQWTGYRADASERFFRDDQTVTLTVSHPEELLYFQYAVSDQLFENGSVAARKLSFVDYTGTFSTASLNLEEGKPYVIYGFLFTEFKSEIVINTDKIIIDKTAPTITGAKNGDVFCGEGDKTLTVTDLYLDTVTVNDVAVTPNEQGQITLSDARTPQTVVATDKAGNSTTLTVTVHSSHSYQWKTENGQYWGECEFCNSQTERKAIPELTITSPDTVCRTQDFAFSFRLPEGCINPSYSYEFASTGGGEPVTPVDGLCTGTIPAASYQEGKSSFRFIASATTAEGYRFSVDKTITLREHSGGTATCAEQAVCAYCGQSYGDLLPHDFTAETTDAKYLKTAATCTEKAVYYKSCTVCGLSSAGTADEATFESGDPLGHDYGNWTSNQNGTHSRVCSHDAAHTETAPCTGGTATCLEPALCEVCGTGYGEKDPEHHTGTAEWITTEETHKQAYTCCGAVVVAEGSHIYDDEKDATCNVCGFNRVIPHNHTYDGWSTDAENHWRACTDPVCPDPTGSILDQEAHVYDNDKDAICNVCGYVRTITPPAHEHSYGAWSHDETNHWHACTDADCPNKTGSVKDTAAHVYDDAADADCNVCGYVRTITPPAHEHSYGAWSHDETNHWHACTDADCPGKTGSVKDTAAHVYDDDADTTCNVCGYERTVTPPAPAEFIVTFDGNDGTPSVGSMTTTNQKLASLPSASRSGSYSFDGWYTEKSGGTKITTDTVFSANTTVYAHWTYTDGGGSSGYSCYTITAAAGTGGSISPSGNVNVCEGRDQTFTITPDKGYAVSNVKIDGKSIGAVKSYTFENVSRTHTIEVIFMNANGNPQTGDESDLDLWLTVMTASLALAGAAAVALKKRRSN